MTSMPNRLLILVILFAAGCDTSKPEVTDPCPFPVSGFATPALLFNPSKGDTLRVGEPFQLSVSYSGQQSQSTAEGSSGGNAALAGERSFALRWTSLDGSETEIVYEWPGTVGREDLTSRFVADLRPVLSPLDSEQTVAELNASGSFAFEIALEVESVACSGLDRISLVTQNEVVVLD